jgi:hypothetical protein
MSRLTGVRFGRTGRVTYCVTDEDLAVGDAVVVETPEGAARGWVVIAPDQVVIDEVPARPTLVARRALSPVLSEGERASEDMGRFGLAAALVAGADPAALPPELLGRAGVAARLAAGLSARNREYLERKLRLPALGERVETPLGPGHVVEVKVLRELVTVELDGGQTVELLGPGLEIPPEGTSGGHLDRPGERRPRRGRRGGRGDRGEGRQGTADQAERPSGTPRTPGE